MKKMTIAAILVMALAPLMAIDWMRGIAVDGKVRFAPDKTTPGYLPILDECPHPAGTNYVIEVDYWTNRNGRCECVYKQVKIEPKPLRYSRLKLFVAVSQIGKWNDLETWLKSQNVNGMNAWTAFMLANDLAADNELFILWAGRAREALGVDEETFNAILKASED